MALLRFKVFVVVFKLFIGQDGFSLFFVSMRLVSSGSTVLHTAVQSKCESSASLKKTCHFDIISDFDLSADITF